MHRVLAAILAALVAATFSPAFAQSLIVEKTNLRTAELHDGRRRHHQERQDRLGSGGHAQRRQVERHPDHALLHRHQPRLRQIRRERQDGGLLGLSDRARQGHRHRQILRLVIRHAGQPQRQGAERGHHGTGQHRSRYRQALRHALSGGDDAGLRQRAEGAGRKPRHQETESRGRRLDGLAASLSMGGELSRQRRAHRRHCRRAARRRLPHRLARRLGSSRSGSIRNGTAATITARSRRSRAEARAQAHHLAGRAVGMGGERPSASQPADPAKPPAAAMDNKFKIEAALETIAASRASVGDANSLLYLAKANQLMNVDPASIKLPVLRALCADRSDFLRAARRGGGQGNERGNGAIAGPDRPSQRGDRRRPAGRQDQGVPGEVIGWRAASCRNAGCAAT